MNRKELTILPKYNFKIKTRNNVTVDNVSIISADQKTAESRLSQMYPHCELINVEELVGWPGESLNFDKIIDIISK